MKRRKILKIGLFGAVGSFGFKNMLSGNVCAITSPDILGPFYSPNAPVKNNLAPVNANGTKLFITGTIYANDCETPVPKALLDAWQADDSGAYDNAGFNYRGKFNTDHLGSYSFESVLPGKYLNGSYYRPRHIHFKIQGEPGKELTTQLYFEGDSSIPIDPWASDPKAGGRIIPLQEDANNNLHGVFDVYLDIEPDKVTSRGNLKNDIRTQRIISVFPNPATDILLIKFYANKAGEIKLHVYDINARLVKTIHNFESDTFGFYTAELNTLNHYGLKLNKGIYIIQLVVNDAVLDAKRFVIN